MTSVIIGSDSDTHVQQVACAVESMGIERPLILDGPRLRKEGFHVELDRIRHGGRTIELHGAANRGWLRRYAPTAWGSGLTAGSLEAVTLGAFTRLVGAISRLDGVTWLTHVGAMLEAEDRLLQLQAARELGFATPRSIVTSHPAAIVEFLGSEFVVKPLATGYFWTESGPHAVFASRLSSSELEAVDLGAAPFVAQEVVRTQRHFRVVTVNATAWVAQLPAEGFDLDWRRDDAAHCSWLPHSDDELARRAVALARRLRVGYSSQDWVWDGERFVFLDLNPGGQWLFLPEEVAGPVTDAIARFLVGG